MRARARRVLRLRALPMAMVKADVPLRPGFFGDASTAPGLVAGVRRGRGVVAAPPRRAGVSNSRRPRRRRRRARVRRGRSRSDGGADQAPPIASASSVCDPPGRPLAASDAVLRRAWREARHVELRISHAQCVPRAVDGGRRARRRRTPRARLDSAAWSQRQEAVLRRRATLLLRGATLRPAATKVPAERRGWAPRDQGAAASPPTSACATSQPLGWYSR